MGFHSLNSPSSFSRRMGCPGSANAERGKPNKSSPYAAEGTAAHELGERCLKLAKKPTDFLGEMIETDGGEFEVTQEMCDAVEEYVDYCNNIIGGSVIHEIEERLPLPFLGEGESGTADFVGIKGENLYVVDYKHGKGVPVEAKENVQGLCYGLGAALKYHNHDWSNLVIVIVQPRAYHPEGGIREWKITRDDAEDWKLELGAAALATQDEDAPRHVGDWCRFCKGKPDCDTYAEFSMKEAELEFGDTTAVPPAADSYSSERLADLIQNKIPLIEDWCKSVKEYAQEQAEKGNPPAGMKLVVTRNNRKFTVEEDEILKIILEEFDGFEKDDFYKEPSMKTLTQIESTVGKKLFAEKLKDYVTKYPAGTTLVPESDKRPNARPTGSDEFESIEI